MKDKITKFKQKDIKVIGKCDVEEYPMQKKEHSMEFFREHGHLRMRTKLFQSVFRVRHGLSMAIHKFFDEKGFIYFHTPIISASDCEGAGQTFKLEDEEFFGKSAHLTVSGQLEGELGALGLGEVYTFGPTFRAEESFTTRHLSEFWMLEPEMSFYEMKDAIDLAEGMLKYLISYVLKTYPDELEYLSEQSEFSIEKLHSIVSEDFHRLSYREAIEISSKEWGEDLDTETEKMLVAKIGKPVVVYDYPVELKAFYMKRGEDGKTVKGFDILFPEIGEIIGGSEREEDLEKLVDRMKDVGIDLEELDWYLDTRKFGTVPHSGFGLGFERLVMFVTGMKNIRDVIPFPRSPKSIKF